MTPAELQQCLAVHADGELAAELCPEIEGHLARDPQSRIVVARWQALRRAARRTFESEPLPEGLRERILHSLAARPGPRRRYWRIGGAVSAAAAAIVLALFVWGPFANREDDHVSGGPSVTPELVAAIYQHCAVQHHHDPFHLAGQPRTAVVTALAQRGTPALGIHLPDLTTAGFEFVGVCDCPERHSFGTLHAYYVRAGQDAGADEVVSFFTMRPRCRMSGCTQACIEGLCPHHADRQYHVARAPDDVTVIKWEESACGFAVCGRLPERELLQMVDAVDVAGRFVPVSAAVAGRYPARATLAGVFGGRGAPAGVAVLIGMLSVAMLCSTWRKAALRRGGHQPAGRAAGG